MRLRSDEWNKEDHLWLLDVIAPLGAHEEIVKKVKEQFFPEQSLNSLKFSLTGGNICPVSL